MDDRYAISHESAIARWWTDGYGADQAKASLRDAAIFIFLEASVVLGLLLVFLGLRPFCDPTINFGIRLLPLFQIALLYILAWRTYRFSLVWSMLGLLVQGANLLIFPGHLPQLMVVALAILIQIRAIRGALYLRQHPSI